MALKDILVFVDEGASNPNRVGIALSMAQSHEARLAGVTLARLVPQHLKVSNTKALARFSHDAAEQRLAQFSELALSAGVSATTRIFTGNESRAAGRLARYSRNFDLLVLRQPNPANRNFSVFWDIAQQVLLLSGRPVYFVPYIGSRKISGPRAMIAWDGSPSATRAVHDALPLLKQKKDVVITVVREGKSKSAKGEALTENLAGHLQQHGVHARVNAIHAGTYDVPTVILNEVADRDIDLLVMGGYGTPSLKQKVFGGVTRTILESMIVPVLMSH